MEISKVIKGYDLWVQDWQVQNRSVFFLTFQFYHLGGKSKNDAMAREISRFYRTLLTNLVRHPARKSQEYRLPIMIAIPDRPVAKHDSTHRLGNVRPNDGLHYHALLSVDPVNRLRGDFLSHINANRERYLGSFGIMTSIHVVPVTYPGEVVDYLFKQVKRSNFSLDDILIFPKSRNELLMAPRNRIANHLSESK